MSNEDRTEEFVERLMGSGPFSERSLAQQAGTLLIFLVVMSVLASIWLLLR